MQDAVLSCRNLWRNRRRSLVTILAVALGCGGLILFGGYVSWAFRGVEMQTVASYGHVQIYKKGYYEHGIGNPADYALDNYEELKRLLLEDPVIGPSLELVTGQLVFNGIASSAKTRTSSTFFGLGVFPSEDKRLWQWNPYGLFPAEKLKANAQYFGDPPELSDDDPTGGSAGIGLGRILQLDQPARESPAPESAAVPENSGGEVDMGFLRRQANTAAADDSGRPGVELLVSPPDGGIPSVTTLAIRKIAPRATKELDDQLIKLPIQLASSLLFPGKPLHVTTVALLLKRTADTGLVTRRLEELIRTRGLDLEFKTWTEVRPFYRQIKQMLGIIFVFVFIIMVTLVAFTIYNTQSAGILERMGELGTLRAMGVTRLNLWKMLVLEGMLLGLFGGLLGIGVAVLGDLLLQAVDIIYVPPGVSFYAKV